MDENSIDQWRARIAKAIAFVEGVDDDDAWVDLRELGTYFDAYAATNDCRIPGIGHGPTKAEALTALEGELKRVWSARRRVLDGGLRILDEGTETSSK